jgi:hypothetical protein
VATFSSKGMKKHIGRQQLSAQPPPSPFCHPEEGASLRQVKSEMNAEIDIDSVRFIVCSFGEVVIILIFHAFGTPHSEYFSKLPQDRHPERL